MATDWASMVNAAYQRLVQGYSGYDKQRTDQLNNTKRSLTGLGDQNKKNKMNTAISAVDRGMQRSGAYVQAQGDVAKNYNAQVDLTNRNNAASLADIAAKKLAVRAQYDQTMANIKKQQSAENMARIAQLPSGINFAALKAMNGGR
jgi:hypothetical protein